MKKNMSKKTNRKIKGTHESICNNCFDKGCKIPPCIHIEVPNHPKPTRVKWYTKNEVFQTSAKSPAFKKAYKKEMKRLHPKPIKREEIEKIDVNKIRGEWRESDEKGYYGGNDTISSIKMVADKLNQVIDFINTPLKSKKN